MRPTDNWHLGTQSLGWDCTILAAVRSDTKAIIGTIVGSGLVLGGLLSAQIAVQVAGINVRIDDMNKRIDDMNDCLGRLEADVRSMDARLRAVEVAVGKVDLRLLTIERVVLPTRTASD